MVAHTSSGTERSTFSTTFHGARNLGSASTMPATAASSVPTTEIAKVSQIPTATAHNHARLVSGGKNPVTKSAMAEAASPVNKAHKSISSNCQLATTPASNATSTAMLRTPQALARAAGVTSSARRSALDKASASSTSAIKTSKMEQASPPLSIFMA